MSRPRKKKHPQLPVPVPPNPCFRTFPKSPFKKKKKKKHNQQANRFERDNVLVQVSVCVFRVSKSIEPEENRHRVEIGTERRVRGRRQVEDAEGNDARTHTHTHMEEEEQRRRRKRG